MRLRYFSSEQNTCVSKELFLFRHRDLVPPLWLLPGHPYAGNVCRAYHSVFRYTCRPFLLAGIHSHYWGHRYLVVYSYRLVSSRLSRHCLLPLSQICSLTDLTKIRLRYTFITGFSIFAAVKSNDKLWTTVFREK